MKKREWKKNSDRLDSINWSAELAARQKAASWVSVNSRQDHVHTGFVGQIRRDSARVSNVLVVTNFVEDFIACLIAWRLVRFQWTQLRLRFWHDFRLQSLYDWTFAPCWQRWIIQRLFLSKSCDWIGDQSWSRHKWNFLPRHLSSL